MPLSDDHRWHFPKVLPRNLGQSDPSATFTHPGWASQPGQRPHSSPQLLTGNPASSHCERAALGGVPGIDRCALGHDAELEGAPAELPMPWAGPPPMLTALGTNTSR